LVKRRIIPTLLSDGVSLVKGERFHSWRTVGSVVAAARVFAMRDVDELTVLDVRATGEHRSISPGMIAEVAEALQVPLSVGGGIASVEAFEAALRAGADKVVLGTAALDADFVTACANRFGSQAVVVAVDVLTDGAGETAVLSGTRPTGITATELAVRLADAGAGEILVQTVDRDGTLTGMNVESFGRIARAVSVPVIASSGAGGYDDLHAAFETGVDAVAAGAMFQFTEQTPKGARDFLAARGVDVRISG
jgi:cyclase